MTYPFTVKLYSGATHLCGRAGVEVATIGLALRWMAELECEVAVKRSDISRAQLLDHAAAKTEDYWPTYGSAADRRASRSSR